MKRFLITFLFIVIFNIWIFSQTFFSPGQNLFNNSILNDFGDSPRYLYSKDLNGDGFNDILASTHSNKKVIWFPNSGNGSFEPLQTIATGLTYVRAVRAGDLNNDGNEDVVIASVSNSGNGGVLWLRNTGAGNFATQTTISDTINPIEIEISDLDGDLNLDLIVAAYPNLLLWYKGDGTGNFEAPNIISDSAYNVNSLDIIDIDNDSDLDILTALYDNNYGAVQLFTNNGSGSFTKHEVIDTINYVTDSKAIDVDSDGDLDIISCDYGGEQVIYWSENLGNLTFGAPLVLIDTVGQFPENLLVADIDNDGDDDFAHFGYYNYSNDSRWFENNGDGSFTLNQVSLTSQYTNERDLIFTDIDNDGDLEIVRSSYYYYFAALLWGDNDGNGNFTAQPEIYLNLSGGIQEMALLDLDADGDLDIAASFYYTSSLLNLIINAGDGDFNYPTSSNQGFNSIRAIDKADMDGDSDLDLLISQSSMDPFKRLLWVENEGSGQFDSIHYINSDSVYLNEIVSGDIDNDGDIDLISASGARNVFWLENDGNGAIIGSHAIPNSDKARSVSLADIDGDGDLDVLSTNNKYDYLYDDSTYEGFYQYTLIWYENVGNGVFTGAPSDNVEENKVYDVTAADLDNDGDLDVIGAFYDYGAVIWTENLGGGLLDSSSHILYFRNDIYQLEVTDLDNDGDIDIVANTYFGDLAWFENIGAGSFSDYSLISDGNSTGQTSFLIGDLDQDGDDDVVFNDYYDGEDMWFENLFSEEITTIEGQIYWDKNEDSTFNAGDEAFAGVAVQMQPDGYTFYTNNIGVYKAITPSAGTHTLQLTPPVQYDCGGQIEFNLVEPEAQPFSFEYEAFATIKQDFVFTGTREDCRTISGRVFDDANQNGVFDNGESGLRFIKVTSDGFGYVYSDNNGFYEYEMLSSDSTELMLELSNIQNSNQCSSSYVSYTQTFPADDGNHFVESNGGNIDNLDFGVYTESENTFDVGLYSLYVYNGNKAGKSFHAYMDFKAQGNITETCSLRIDHDPAVSLINASLPPATIEDDFVEWIFPPGSAPSLYCMQMDWIVDTTLEIGDVLHWEANYNCDPGIDGCPANNNLVRDVTIIQGASRIENAGFAELMSTNAEGIMPTIIEEDAFLSYVISFQNPLETPAYNVSVIDTLPSQLDYSTVSRPFSSYPFYDFTLSEDGILKIDLNGIHLSDPNINELNSYGFIQFNVKLKEGLAEGTEIANAATVLFNGQATITTNEVLHKLDNSVAVQTERAKEVEISVAPNPLTSQSVLYIESGVDTKYDIEIVDVAGKKMRAYNQFSGKRLVIDKEHLNSGVYLINLYDSNDKQRVTSLKLVVN